MINVKDLDRVAYSYLYYTEVLKEGASCLCLKVTSLLSLLRSDRLQGL